MEEFIKEELVDLVDQCADELSYGLYRQLLNLSERFTDKALYKAIEEELSI